MDELELDVIEEIYDRIGGAAAVGAAVNKLYERLVDDPETKTYFAQADMRNIKKHQRAFLAVALGGPDAYYGRGMMEAHGHLKITDREFDVVAKHLTAVLVELQVPAPDVAAVKAIVESQRHVVVTGTLTGASG